MNDREARERIRQDLNTNFMVEASAGSGKTASLVSRVVAGLIQGVYRVENLAVVTFTRKAAAELSSRLRLELEKAGAAEALAHFPEMFLGTIHSFCGQILREYPVESGISPTFQEMEETADRNLQRRMLRIALEETQGQFLRRQLAEFGASPTDLLPALQQLCDHGDLEYPAPNFTPPDLPSSWQKIQAFARSLQPHLPESCEADPTCKVLSLSLNLLNHLRRGDPTQPQTHLRVLGDWETSPKPVKRYWGVSRAEQNSRLETVQRLLEEFRTTFVLPQLAFWRAYLYGLCLPFLVHVRQQCQEERRVQGLVSYHDLLRKCRNLLVEQPQVLQRLQLRYQHLLVDEFQDTDPLQAEIFWRLAADRVGLADWRQLRPRAASLFLVGDPKQSIYRFRQADIELYHLLRNRLLFCGGQVLTLSSSFRSSPALCAWINTTFQQILPAYSPLVSQKDPSPGPAVRTLTLSSSRYGEVSDDEAERIADYIQASGRVPGDFMILTSRKAELPLYQQALQARGIPFQSSGEPKPLEGLGQAFLGLLKALADPSDRAALVGALRGRFFGHSDSELFLHCQAKGPLRIVDQPATSEVDSSLALLHRLREGVRRLAAGAAAQRIAEELALSQLQGADEIDSLVEELSEAGESGMTLSQSLSEILEAGTVLPRNLHSGQSDVVRIMNLHKAKGLEAKVVFLAAPTQGLPSQVDHALTHEGRGLLCLRRQRKLLAHPIHWEQQVERELIFLAEERQRLLYVAATRARDLLVVGRWTGTHGSAIRPWQELEPFLNGCPELDWDSSEQRKMPTGPIAEQVCPENREVCRTQSWQRSSVSLSNKKQSVRGLIRLANTGYSGKEWGDLIHKLLEQMVRKPHTERGQLAKLARWFTLETPQMAAAVEPALDLLEKVRASPFWSRILKAQERRVEVPFGRMVDRQQIFGIIDLVLRESDGWKIVDYKTDRLKREDLLQSYSSQIAEYANSWTAITGEAVIAAELFGIRELEEISVDSGDPPGPLNA